MRIPLATYRLQFGPSLRFQDARALVPYLSELGISDLYASPIFAAAPGSTHGYDVTDPNELNPELGTEADFQTLVAELRDHQMGWLQDIVPNHMAYSSTNWMLMDLLENGPRSRYWDFFDIFRDHPDPALRTRVMAPFLGRPLEDVLRDGELQLVLDDQGLAVRYFAWRFPLCLASYHDVLGLGLGTSLVAGRSSLPKDQRRATRDERPGMQALTELRETFARLSEMDDSPDKRRQVAQAKSTLGRLHREHPMIRAYLEGVLERYNRALTREASVVKPEAWEDSVSRSAPHAPRATSDESGTSAGSSDEDPWHRLLDRQMFKPVFWKIAHETINYRRFFYLSEFIALRPEEPRVFEQLHAKILELVRAGIFTGLRVDHIDGLYHPRQYLQRLHGQAPQTYLVVEKILELYEFLRADWPIQGTSGYKFCNYVNGIFCRQESETTLTNLYHEFIGTRPDYAQVLYEEKKKILEQRMAGEVAYLTHLALQAARDRCPGARDPGRGSRATPEPDTSWPFREPSAAAAVQKALTTLIAAFPLYRTYADTGHFTPQDQTILRRAAAVAAARCPACRADLDDLVALLLSGADQQEHRHFLMRFQQFTGPAMAKGLEDTALYIYNRFLSLNEVGGDPGTFGLSLEQFHGFLQLRARDWPHAMNATSTHDSKRGEDVRARLNVLSEMPDRWGQAVGHWAQMNERHKQRCGEGLAPDRNDEYLLYQTLVGALPFEIAGSRSMEASKGGSGEASAHPGFHASTFLSIFKEFKQRIADYMVKAVREAKTHSNWVEPNEPYESACRQFIDRVLDDSPENPFWADFLAFAKEVSAYGIYNSLSQTALKITCTGLPDFYQGAELWDLNLVDPDNRRPVDFEKRRRMLREVDAWKGVGVDGFTHPCFPASTLPLSEAGDGRIKLFLIYRALRTRWENRDLFEAGEHVPATVTGRQAEHLVAFFRRKSAPVEETGKGAGGDAPAPPHGHAPTSDERTAAGDVQILVVVPRFLASLVRPDQLPLGPAVWGDTSIALPADAPRVWHNAITGGRLEARDQLPVGDILSSFPVAILVGRAALDGPGNRSSQSLAESPPVAGPSAAGESAPPPPPRTA